MKSEFVYNPENFAGHSHAATMAIHNNELYMSWYVYKDKEHENGQIVVTKFNKQKNEWPKANFIFPSLSLSSTGNPVLFSYQGRLNLFFVILKGTYWDTAQIVHSYFDEKTNTWSNPNTVNTEKGIMIRHRPVCFNGYGVVPAYNEKTMETILYKFSDQAHSWEEHSKFSGEYIQGDIVTYNQFEWQMYLRAAGKNSKVMKAMSANSGKSWNVARATNLHCPLSGIAAIKLNSGNILLCNNNTERHKRTPISLSLSNTKGATFDLGTWHVDETDIELSYPTLIQEEDGLIHLAFTFNRKMIKHISMTEEELLEKLGSNNA